MLVDTQRISNNFRIDLIVFGITNFALADLIGFKRIENDKLVTAAKKEENKVLGINSGGFDANEKFVLVVNGKHFLQFAEAFGIIEKRKYVITKDLSRLGRNYVLTGQYTDIYFPSKGVRYIAVSDGVDSEKGESEIAPFLNILNEMHARQTSKKVKAAVKTRFLGGAHYGAYAPIGYKKHPEIKGELIPDEDTRWIVEKIFDLAAHGVGAAKIRRTLDDEHIPTPAWLNYQKYGTFAHIFEGQSESKQHQWTTSNVKDILSNEVYIGNSVHNKQTTISFKNKKKVRKSKDEWFIVENTHEPIISRELWNQAQVHIDSRKR